MGSNAYISDIAKKSTKNKTSKNVANKKNKINFRKYDGKVYDPTINKSLNSLKQTEKQIIKEIQKRNNNINLLKMEININNANNIQGEKKKNEEKIKLLEKENDLCFEKLEEIKNRRNALQFKHEKELGIFEKNKKLRLKQFLVDLNNKEKNELIEEKFKKFQEDSKKIQLKMQEEMKEVIERKHYEIEKKKIENEEKTKKFINDKREKEKEDIKNRNQKAREQVLKLKVLINNKPISTSLIYKENEDKYLKNEKQLVNNENERRKEYMKRIELNELNEFAKNFDEKKSKKLIESNLKIEKEKEKWSQRYKLIPQYTNPLTKIISDDEKKIKEKVEKMNLEKKKYKELQKHYKVPRPLIIFKEKKENNNNKKHKKLLIKSGSYSDILRQKMKIKFYTNKNIKEKEEEENNKKMNKKIINFKLPLICIKEKARTINKSFEKVKNNQKNELITEYLRQKRLINEKIREKKRNSGELPKYDLALTNDIKKLIKDNGMDQDVLNLAKSKLENLQEKKKEKSLLLKVNGGIDKNPEIADEICDLMLDSIQAGLSIIEGVENSDEINNDYNNRIKNNNVEE